MSAFAAFTAHLARTFPSVKEFIVGNEPNQTRFWQPQFGAGGGACVAFTRVLAASYDALKGVDCGEPGDRRRPLPARQRRPEGEGQCLALPRQLSARHGRRLSRARAREAAMDELSFHPTPRAIATR